MPYLFCAVPGIYKEVSYLLFAASEIYIEVPYFFCPVSEVYMQYLRYIIEVPYLIWRSICTGNRKIDHSLC